tara:strand:- start:759 stop:1103 length:345 start_codon:yes stop_codon:yes gene_type:complete
MNINISQEALDELTKPLEQEHYFSVEYEGRLILRSKRLSFCSQRKKMRLSDEHIVAYLICVRDKLEEYQALIERNQQIQAHYRKPTFSPEDAREMAQEALETSFWQVAKGYVLH